MRGTKRLLAISLCCALTLSMALAEESLPEAEPGVEPEAVVEAQTEEEAAATPAAEVQQEAPSANEVQPQAEEAPTEQPEQAADEPAGDQPPSSEPVAEDEPAAANDQPELEQAADPLPDEADEAEQAPEAETPEAGDASEAPEDSDARSGDAPEDSDEPEAEVIPGASAEPEASEAPEVTEEPEPEAAPDPTAEDTPEPIPEDTPEPTEEAAPLPATALTLSVALPAELPVADGVWQIDLSQVESITLAWIADGACDYYGAAVTDAEGGVLYSAYLVEAALTLPLSGLPAGTYAFSVSAVTGDVPTAQAQLLFTLIQQEQPSETTAKDGLPGVGMSGGFPGGFRRGSVGRKAGGAQGGGASGDDAQGFHITPGEALTSAHNSGSSELWLYGSVALETGEEPMERLVLGDAELDIGLIGGGVFTASLTDADLTLSAEDESGAWTLNGYALKTLWRSGIELVNLSLGDGVTQLPTQVGLSGSVYAKLCAAGYVSKDYEYIVADGAVEVVVDGEAYRLTAEGELEAVEGK